MKFLAALAFACAALGAHAQAGEVPSWFGESFLEIPQDVKEAAADEAAYVAAVRRLCRVVAAAARANSRAG